MPLRLRLVALLTGALSACSALNRDDRAARDLELTEAVAYWSVRGTVGANNYIRPIVRFRLRNRGSGAVDYVQTMAVFRREKNPEESWGNAFEFSISGEPLLPGQVSRPITLRSDSYYYSKDEPEEMFESGEWQQVTVEIFLRVGSSAWTPATKLDVPKRIGAPGVEKFLEPSG